jgi:hypothetical protein
MDAFVDDSEPEVVGANSDLQGLFVSAMVAPNLDIFPVPAEFVAGKTPIDLAAYDTWGAAAVKQLVSETLPDEQLAYLRQLELDREKPRAVALKAIEAEMSRRGPVFSNWVTEHCTKVIGARVVGLSWAWCDEEPVSCACLTPDEERKAFCQLLDRVRALHRESDGNVLMLGYDCRFVLQLIRLRMISLGWFEPSTPFWELRPFWVNQSFIAECESLGGREVLAKALGLTDVPEQPSHVDVLNAVLAGHAGWLSDRVAERLMAERDMLILAEKVHG